LESRILLSGDLPALDFTAVADAALTLRAGLDPTGATELQLITDTGETVDSVLLSELTSESEYAARIYGAEFDVDLTIDASALAHEVIVAGGIVFDAGTGVGSLSGPDTPNAWVIDGSGEGGTADDAIRFIGLHSLAGGTDADSIAFALGGSLVGGVEGGAGIDTLTGPDTTNLWEITGADEGTLNGVAFAGIESLEGGTGSPNEFVFFADGSISGLVSGGDGGSDALILEDPEAIGTLTVVNPYQAGPATAILALYGKSIEYAEMESIVDTSSTNTVVIFGSFFDDQLVLEDSATPGEMQIRSTSGDFFDAASGLFVDTMSFATPTAALNIHLLGGWMGFGQDTLEIVSLSENFGADLAVTGGELVNITGNLDLDGGSLSIDADTINVSGVVSTRRIDPGTGNITLIGRTITIGAGAGLLAGPSGAAGDVTLQAEDNFNRQTAWYQTYLSPVDLGTNSATISISGATIEGRDITISATAEDRNFYDDYGDFGAPAMEGLLGVLDQIPGLAISAITGIAGQFVRHHADATVSVGSSSIDATGDVVIESHAFSDASIHTVSINGVATGGRFTLAFGYGEAHSTAITTIDHTTIEADGSVDIASNAETKAKVKARTASNTLASSNPKNISLAAAVANTSETSHVTISEGSYVASLNEGVNIDAKGGVTNFAWAAPTIDEDGTVAVAFALDLDKADIKTWVHGTIVAAGGFGDTFDATITGDVDYEANAIHFPGHGFIDGQQVTYSHGATDGTDVGGLTDGNTYYVQVIDENTIRLADAPTIDLAYTQLDSVASQHTVGRLAKIDFDSEGVDTDAETITFADPHDFLGGEALTYIGTVSNPDADGIEQNHGVGGLEQGRTYYVIVVEGNDHTIQLAESEGSGTPIDLTEAGVGEHAFLYQTDKRAFAPQTAVDAANNTITFTDPHGYQTGDAVIYHTDPSVSFQRPSPPAAFDQGLAIVDGRTLTLDGDNRWLIETDAEATLVVDGVERAATVLAVSYDTVGDTTTVVLDREVLTVDLTRATFAGTAAVTVSDAPIDGLSDGDVYYVVEVDEDLGNQHSISGRISEGIDVHAGLSATNAINAKTTIGGQSGVSLKEVLLHEDRILLQAEHLLEAIQQISRKLVGKQPDSDVQAGNSFGIAGSVVVNYADHDVEAIVGPTAQLTSHTDIAVSAEIDQASQVASDSGASKPADDDAAASVAVAVGLGIFDNSAKAIVEGGAQLDAHGEVAVTSDVDYDFLLDNPIPF
jgi:hypothetical protein